MKMGRNALLGGEEFQTMESVTKEGYPMSFYLWEDLQKRELMLMNSHFSVRFCLWAHTCFEDRLTRLEVPGAHTLGSLPESTVSTFLLQTQAWEITKAQAAVKKSSAECQGVFHWHTILLFASQGGFFPGFRFDNNRDFLSFLWLQSLGVLLLPFCVAVLPDYLDE